jgi:hypothetical protein
MQIITAQNISGVLILVEINFHYISCHAKTSCLPRPAIKIRNQEEAFIELI